ncbi:hypothetical protein HNR46_002649 [Haloferula luteola]|uniref:Uncharacterized protein n=1 Tax=Haloferula luteola TaxID=595692 RepID=A0A840VA10_9BACT|nr:hypothetical protein [Haloferula luteola]MBB5352404.1 hypothetical protein [Haloferula luteola]
MIACLLTALLAGSAASSMTAEFANGDILHGHLDAVTGDQLAWSSPLLTHPAPLRLKDLQEIRIPSARESELPEGKHTARVTLSNGDSLRGVLLDLTAESVVLKTHYAGILTLRRDMVASLDVRDRAAILYRGPSDLTGWTQEDDTWQIDQGSLVCQGAGEIRREIGVHPKIRIGIDVDWNDRTDLSIRTHGQASAQGELESYYELACQNQYVSFRKRLVRGNNRGQIQPIGSAGAVEDLGSTGSVHIEMLQDIENGLFRLIVGDQIVTDWRDNDPLKQDPGPMLEFVSQQSAGIRITRIQIESWDGVLEGGFQARQGFGRQEPAPNLPEKPRQGEIQLRNGDTIDGGITRIQDGLASIDADLRDFQLPVDRLRAFPLRTEEDARDPEKFWRPIRRNGDIRAYFADGGCVTFKLEALENGTLRGSSQTFGTAQFDFSVFSSIQFNLYQSPAWYHR